MSAHRLTQLFDGWRGGSAPSLKQPVQMHFCPGGRTCAFIITDHGDRTRVAPTRAVYRGHSDKNHPSYDGGGLLPHGVRITQGTFWSGWASFDYLDESEFFEIMKEAHEAGNEICPHNTSEIRDLTAKETRANMHKYARHFGLTTWIDHGHLPSNLSKQGLDPDSEYYILSLFKELGGTAAWTFEDRYTNPRPVGIDMLHPPAVRTFVCDAVTDAFRWLLDRKQHFRARANALLTVLMGAKAMYHAVAVLRRPAGTGSRAAEAMMSVRSVGNQIRHRSRWNAFPFFFDENHELIWFDAIRVNLISQVYRPEAIEHLISDAGFHLGHTYLGLVNDRHGDIAVERIGEDWTVTPGFGAFLAKLGEAVREMKVWNPTVREAVGYFEAMTHLRLDRCESHGWLLQNESDRPFHGLTVRSLHDLVIPPELRPKASEHQGEQWYVIDIPPRYTGELHLKMLKKGHCL